MMAPKAAACSACRENRHGCARATRLARPRTFTFDVRYLPMSRAEKAGAAYKRRGSGVKWCRPVALFRL